ncbi:MAG: PhoH family protein [Planctomycetaceae bacterium]|nr:PhoH family protein [Planctomycetaceae bacterium]
MPEGRIRFRNHDEVRSLFGTRDRNLRRLRDVLQIDVVLRGDELHLFGEPDRVERGTEVITELRSLIERKGYLADEELDRVLDRSQEFAHGGADSIDVFHKARKVQPKSPGQAEYSRAIRDHDCVFCAGPAGSGKTYLAVAMAINALRQDLVRKIVLVRPAVEAGEKLGFLPGDMLAKVNPYLRPLLDALSDILDFDQVQRYLDKDVIEIIPLAFMRGRTLNNTFMILDEAQNTTITQMMMFLTRMGNSSKIVVTGDATQTDLPDHVESGLHDAMNRLKNVPGIGMVTLSGGDIVRHPLVRRIVAAYDLDRRERTGAPRSNGDAAHPVVMEPREAVVLESSPADSAATTVPVIP